MRNVTTTTISLPKAMARRARQLSREENSTMSELFREAFRNYEASRLSGRKIDWEKMKAELQEIGRSGKGGNLSAFIIRDRQSH